MERKPVFVNMTYNRIASAIPKYVKKITGALDFDSVEMNAVAGASRGGFVKQFTASIETRKLLKQKFPEQNLFTISLDNRYQYPDMTVVFHLPDRSNNFVEAKLIYRSIRHSDHVVAISDTTARDVESRFSKKDIHVIKIGLEAHEPVQRMEHSGIVVSQIGGISSGKSRRLPMLKVPGLLRKAFPNEELTFIHVGGRDNENERDLLEACKDHDINPEFRSGVSDEYIWDVYARSDLYVYLSTIEGYSLTPMEALSMGTPCLISDIDVHREVYDDKKGVSLVSNDKVTAQDIKEAYGMGTSLSYRKQALERTWDHTIKEYDKLIRDLA